MASLISSQVDVNMITAQKRDAARQGQFYFRKTLKKCECMIKLVFFYLTEDIRDLSRYCHPNALSRELHIEKLYNSRVGEDRVVGALKNRERVREIGERKGRRWKF